MPTDGKRAEKATVLLVDDQPFFIRYHSAILTGKGYQVITASNGNEALEQARRFRPDIIILDLEMPGLNGIETCETLKAEEATRQIPIIILTATKSLKLNEMAFKAGAEATVYKSVGPERFLNMVGVVLGTEKADTSLDAQSSPFRIQR